MVLLPSSKFPVLVLSVSSFILLNTSSNVIFFLLLHQFFVTVVYLIAHTFHNFLHTSVTSSDFFKSFLLLSLGCLHLFVNSLCFFPFELLMGDGSLLSIFFIIFNDFESSSLINFLLRSQLLLIHCKVLL